MPPRPLPLPECGFCAMLVKKRRTSMTDMPADQLHGTFGARGSPQVRDPQLEQDVIGAWPLLSRRARALMLRMARTNSDFALARTLDAWDRYVAAALALAQYEPLEDGTIY